MKLSEAIRLGSMLHGQGFGRLVIEHFTGVVKTCALGAAGKAVGIVMLSDARVYPQLREAFPLLNKNASYEDREDTVMELIWHMNDDMRMSREQIADWVEGVEHDLSHNDGRGDDHSEENRVSDQSADCLLATV